MKNRKADVHYLTCQDKECERAACVDRRDYENQISVQGNLIENIDKCLKKMDRFTLVEVSQIKAEIKILREYIRRKL